MPLDDLINGADFVDAVLGGWRYLLSSSYRLEKRLDWRECGWGWMLLEITFGVLGVLLSVGLVALLVWQFVGR